MPKRIAHILTKNCVACGACTKVCPKSALTIHQGCYAKVDRDLCIGCGKCSRECPANAVEIQTKEDVS